MTHLRLAQNHGAAGRNAGVLAARTPLVALCDDDTWWAPGSLGRAAHAMEKHRNLAVVTARVLVGPADRDDPTCAEMAQSPLPRRADLPGPPLLGFLAGASMIRRVAFLEAGGFEPRFFLGGEERLLAVDLARAGWSMAYLPAAIVHHHPSPVRDVTARRILLARNDLWFTWLRRPLPSAVRATARLLSRAPHDPVARRAVFEALRGLPWVLRERRALPDAVERDLRVVTS